MQCEGAMLGTYLWWWALERLPGGDQELSLTLCELEWL